MEVVTTARPRVGQGLRRAEEAGVGVPAGETIRSVN